MLAKITQAAEGALAIPGVQISPYIYGAAVRFEGYCVPLVNADGTIGHAELGIGDAVLMLAEASSLWPDVPVRAPDHPATFSVKRQGPGA